MPFSTRLRTFRIVKSAEFEFAQLSVGSALESAMAPIPVNLQFTHQAPVRTYYDAVVSPSVAKLWWRIRPAKPKNLIPMKAAA